MKLKKHSGDCTIYSSLINNQPEDGICTCGYGLQVLRETRDNTELYSEELKWKLIAQQPVSEKEREGLIKMLTEELGDSR